jgi:hypothetical protein
LNYHSLQSAGFCSGKIIDMARRYTNDSA